MKNRAASKIKKTVSKRRKPPLQRDVYTVTADFTNGSLPLREDYYDLEEARRQADWLFNSPGFMNVQLTGPKHEGPVYRLAPHDEAVGAWLAAALEDRKVCPSMKFDITRWMDSKYWGDAPQGVGN